MKVWDIVIAIIVVLAYFVLSPKKKQVKKNPPPFLAQEHEEEQFEPVIVPQAKPYFETLTRAKRLDEKEYFTYETPTPSHDLSYEKMFEEPELEYEKLSQVIHNEEEDDFFIHFDHADFYKGIIFSEILKRPYS